MKFHWLRLLAAVACLICVAFVIALLPVSGPVAMFVGGMSMIAFQFWKPIFD